MDIEALNRQSRATAGNDQSQFKAGMISNDPATISETEKQDTTIRDLEQEITILSRLLLAARDRYQYRLERAHYSILTLLSVRESLSVGQIASALLLDNSTASRQVAVMENRGLLTRTADTVDQRRSVVTMSDLGRQMHTEMREARLAETQHIVSEWAPGELEHFARLIRSFNRTLAVKLRNR